MFRSLSLLILVALSVLVAACGSDSKQDACSNIGLPSKIMSGTRCGDEQRSSVVLLTLYDDGDKKGHCSGSVIGSQAVLTAAHCVHDMDKIRISVGGRDLESREFYKDPESDVDGRQIKDVANDLAIIMLPEAANVPTLPLLVSRQIQEGEEFSIYGYGISDKQKDDKDLRSGTMDADKVKDGYIESEYTDDSSSVCFGDSGGPATLTDNDDPATTAIVGVASGLSQTLPIPIPPLPGLADREMRFPAPLPLPFFGTSCQEGDRTFHASVQTSSALDFIRSRVPDLRER